MSKSKDDEQTAGGDCPSFEEALERLDRIVHELEEGKIGLTDSLARYEEGVKLLKQCTALLESAERKIELVTGVDVDGNPVTVAFDDQTLTLEEKADSRGRRRSSSGPKEQKAANPAAESSEIDDSRSLF